MGTPSASQVPPYAMEYSREKNYCPYFLSNNKSKINHLLYRNKLKIYPKSRIKLKFLIKAVKIFSRNIKMKFQLQKCAILVMKQNKIERADEIVKVGWR